MINFVTTRSHGYTVRHLIRQLGNARHWSYERLFRQKELRSGTWVFTDHERLSHFEIALAAGVANRLERGGARVLNHPARVLGRHDLLKALHAAGINCFSAWRCESQPRPNAFPVFIRNEFDHLSADFELIADQPALEAALSRMKANGIPLAGKLVIEYAGQEVSPGVWQRFATYRVGDRLIAHHNVVDFRWAAKDVQDKQRLLAHPMLATFVENERRFVVGNLYEDVLRRAFDLAGIDYGRADFSLVDERPQIFEINTNPAHGSHGAIYRETHPGRVETQKLSEDRLYAALRDVDLPAGGRIGLDDPALLPQQAFRRLFTGLKRA
ncbi:hypothetical protein NKI77_30785 [Mesorhizobium opportunistum]|uniref:ATP-grasp domain-containing protein n=1 Tax=Mesorhizobium opportunistum TaxID=593909 RepID=A0ABV1Y9V3_9HYPH|nr:hypothetical protein [Mesorhizobium sp.]TIN93966.1 MAG: hypothetical protein E5Y06_17485 [Mesorhizobium sp.]TJV01497.1 MAG: hypothetical protein E5Y08_03050 [Mesorhizobium sp.]TJV06049.1 MAG: hypothetical protein E5Y12_06475 [Mesorhizobium sp.]TJV20110.1 MAG: hypothetical protein E5Y07_02740 [Mesorhizobium sp.]